MALLCHLIVCFYVPNVIAEFSSIFFLSMVGRIIEDIALKVMDHSSILVPVLVAFLRDVDSDVVRQSIVSGTNFFCSVLEEMALQVTFYLYK